ncbi:MAG: TetR/AcrR family transcriptional regulator [candidate division Zixibacteria bacterium]|nr:TetR/AcrR family transcriptional regulator [candidate division Zixibacteria bacterium]
MDRKLMEREARREFVLDAARGLFAEKGVDTTSMDDIAAAVGYTRRTLYSYFKRRDEISLLVFTEDLAMRWRAQKAAIATVISGRDKIIAWGESFYRFAGANPHAMRLQFYWDFKGIDRERLSDETFATFETLNNELADGLRAMFRLGVSDGSLRADLNIDMSISQYLYSLRSILNRALSPAYTFARFDPDDYVNHYLDLFDRGIRNTGGDNQ